ncbi:polysaccharide deacetylase family protein [Alkalinema sp. FACHB-956]|uniref:polysaccharide deacetylase family protein n=1 Tax=Alkalinema sp. FACHB-956 TaxID=2692768 RepID=UPI001687D900|nr:polysaccharide deacetylase family protein [Alkalinema sp. FACHB-956]MBD2328924.1 polysaccharide deacetylase family protein [Alkalinema sp. FACHB-956]
MPRRDRFILLSFDVEEFDIPLEYGQTVDPETQFQVSLQGLQAVLGVLDRLNVRATFFTTANFALRFPEVMQAIAQRHEVASHGFYHSSFEVQDLAKSRQVLADVTGQAIVGYRMARLQPVADREIAAAGYRYNSSMNPTWIPGRYNNLKQPRQPYRVDRLLNIPVSVTPGIRFPLFWLSFKNLPLWCYKLLSVWTLVSDRQLNLYFHPWEFGPIQGYGLPQYIARHGGAAMVTRLERYLRWIGRYGQFVTFAEFCDRTTAPHQQPQLPVNPT